MRCAGFGRMLARREGASKVRRARRHPLAHVPVYRVAVPLLIVLVGIGTVVILILAGGVLLGVVPYPGR